MDQSSQKLAILKKIFGTARKSGDEYLFYCPKCQHHKPKLSVHIEKDVFKCWVCQERLSGSSIFRLVRKYGNFLQRQAWEEFETVADYSISLYEQMFGDKEEKKEESISLPEEFISLANKKLPLSSIEARNYLKKDRGLTQEDIVRWKIGYCREGEYKNRVIIPSFNLEGKVNYFIARTYGKDFKYKNPIASKDIIFNELFIDWKNPVHIVEGAFDAIVAGNSIPLLQSSLREDSKLFQEITKHDTPVYIALDPDAEKSAMSLIRKLMEYDIECYKVDIPKGTDVGEIGKNKYRFRVEKAELMNSKTYLKHLAHSL